MSVSSNSGLRLGTMGTREDFEGDRKSNGIPWLKLQERKGKEKQH